MAMEAEKQAAVGRRLKELRGARTQQPIADFVGVTLRAYQAWEAGDSGISWPHIEKLAEYHGVTEDFVLYGSDNPATMRAEQLDRIESKLDLLLDAMGVEAESPSSEEMARTLAADGAQLPAAIESQEPRAPDRPATRPAAGRRRTASS